MVRQAFKLSERGRTHDGAVKLQDKALWDTILLSGTPIQAIPARNVLGSLSELFPMEVAGRTFQYRLPGDRHGTKQARVINLSAQSFYDANVARRHVAGRGTGNMYHDDYCLSTTAIYQIFPTTKDFHIRERTSYKDVQAYYAKYYQTNPDFKKKVLQVYGSKHFSSFIDEVYAAVHGKCGIQDNFIPWSWVTDVKTHEVTVYSSISVVEPSQGTNNFYIIAE